MALRASYYGLKKRILDKVLSDYDTVGVMTNKELTDNVLISQFSSSNNLDDIVTPCRGFWGTSTPTNAPEGKTNCFIEVLEYGGAVLQRVTRPFEGLMYVRIEQSGTWYNWYKFTGTVVS